MKMNKHFATSEEKFLKGVELYVNSSDFLCADADGEVTVDKATVVNLFVKNLLVLVVSGVKYVPVALNASDTYADITYLTEGSQSAVTAAHAYSKEHVSYVLNPGSVTTEVSHQSYS